MTRMGAFTSGQDRKSGKSHQRQSRDRKVPGLGATEANSPAKPDVLTLQKTGSFQFAWTQVARLDIENWSDYTLHREETQLTFQSLELMLAVLLMAEPVLAAQREVIKADWSRFQQQVSMRKLSKRTVRITLSGGGEIKTTLVGVEDNGLIVKATKATKQWASGPEQARIPREQVSVVRFGGRIGHRGLIGGLVGLGAGVAIPVGIGASRGYEEVPVGLAAIVIGPISGMAGYLIGRAMDKPAPEFVIK